MCPCSLNHKNPIRYGDACTIDLDIDIQYKEQILITIIHQFINNVLKILLVFINM